MDTKSDCPEPETGCQNPESCPPGALSSDQIQKMLTSLDPDWKLLISDSLILYREFHFNSYQEGVDFTIKLAKMAEERNHHPEIILGFKMVTVNYWTHDAKGLTELDFIAAAAIDEIQLNQVS